SLPRGGRRRPPADRGARPRRSRVLRQIIKGYITTNMTEDVVRRLGYLTLGTRLKGFRERLQAHTQGILDAHELPIQAAQFPFVAAIDRLGPVTVGEVAEAVGVTQPGATRTLGQLVEAGLIEVTPAQNDLRRKWVVLTKRGKRVVDLGQRIVW